MLWRCRIVGVVGDSATRWWAVAADGCGCGGMVVALWGLRTAGQPRQGLKLGRRRPCEGPKSLSWIHISPGNIRIYMDDFCGVLHGQRGICAGGEHWWFLRGEDTKKNGA